MTVSDNQIPTLQRLIESCQAGERAFRHAADAVKSTELKGLFKACAHQHHRFAIELSGHLKNPARSPWQEQPAAMEAGPKSAPCAAALVDFDQGWAAPMVLEHCLAGEEAALESYRQALSSPLGQNTRFLIKAQLALLQKTHDRMAMLQDDACDRDQALELPLTAAPSEEKL